MGMGTLETIIATVGRLSDTIRLLMDRLDLMEERIAALEGEDERSD